MANPHHVALVGRHCGGLFFDVMRTPAAEWDTSVCQVSHSVCGFSSAAGYDVLWRLILSPLSFFSFLIIKKNKTKLRKGVTDMLCVLYICTS